MPKNRSMVKERYLTLNYQLPRTLYDRARSTMTAGLRKTLENHPTIQLEDHYTDILLFNWGQRELTAERRRTDISRKLQVKTQPPQWNSRERMITCAAKVGEQKYYETLSDLKLLYPEIYYDNQGDCCDFIGYLGTKFARRIKRGDIKLSSSLYQFSI